MSKQSNKVNIRPQVTMLSVLKYIEYETWYALAEFVDNAIASYLKHEKELKAIEGDGFKLEIKIEINDAENRISIRDNAAGIHEADYPRAFRAAEAPQDTSGLSEFGMGMKSAACWFTDEWVVRTAALGETVEKAICFDMKRILVDRQDELEVEERPIDKNVHFTRIELYNVHRMPRRRGLSKVKDHLKSIYREFIRKGILILKVEDEVLAYEEPKILKAAKYTDLDSEPILWRKDISFPIDEKLSVHGFVAIREKASTAEAGFALFRKGRVIEGSFDSGFRPEFIFGAPNSYRYQRIFGELHLEGFEVIFTKKGIKWDENLDVFLKCLRDELNHEDFPLLQQAERYRVRSTDTEYKAAAKKVLDDTVKDLKEKAEKAIDEVRSAESIEEPEDKELPKTEKTIISEFEAKLNYVTWLISIELSYDPSLSDLIDISNKEVTSQESKKSIRRIGIRLSLVHPFMTEFVGADISKIEPVLRLVAAFGLSETIAKESGAKRQGEIRRNLNALIYKLTKKS